MSVSDILTCLQHVISSVNIIINQKLRKNFQKSRSNFTSRSSQAQSRTKLDKDFLQLRKEVSDIKSSERKVIPAQGVVGVKNLYF